MTIDSHQHFWRYDPARHGWITEQMAALKRDFLPEHLLPELQQNQMERCIAVQAEQSETETMFLLDLARNHSFIGGVVGWVDLCSNRLAERLEFFSRFRQLRGFRHIVQDEKDDCFILRENFLRGVNQLQAFGWTYDILVYARQLPAAIEFAARLPEQKLVIDHIAKPEIKAKEVAVWERCLRQMADFPNVHCKLSGLITEASWDRWQPRDLQPYLDIVFDCFGTDRLMFGSDWPVCLLAGTYGQVKEIIAHYIQRFPQPVKDKILGLNAARFYGLAA